MHTQTDLVTDTHSVMPHTLAKRYQCFEELVACLQGGRNLVLACHTIWHNIPEECRFNIHGL